MSCCQMPERENRPYTFLRLTQSTCPECLQLVHTRVVMESGRVYFLKTCPDHGASKALVSEDAASYQKAWRYVRPGSVPLKFQTAANKGCPHDCGLCPSHQQHTCLPIIEITDHCNLSCPVCIADNKNSRHMTLSEFKKIIDRLIEQEGYLETITLSGGEPTRHPEFLKLVDLAKDRAEIGRVSVVTNGIELAHSKKLCEELKKRNVYVVLQTDGFDDAVHQKIRGRALCGIKEKALASLAEYDVSTQIIFVAVRGINEGEIKKAIDLLLAHDHILSLMIQPVSYSGRGGAKFPHDPLNRLTIPGVLKILEEQTGGLLTAGDFFPLPCPHPLCVTLTYLLKLDDGSYIPFPRFLDMNKYLHLFEQSAMLGSDTHTENAIKTAIDDLWSAKGEIPDNQKVLKALKKALLEMYPPKTITRDELMRVTERKAKTVFIHHYMDRHDFDLERLVKCCHHYPLNDGRVMPACSYNMFCRGTAL
ncbi:MAG: radical SAM protein [Deltaproteobacteria bacterium]|nr:radical SAM protein [Deltaproteobacteria bacterium]